MLRPKKNSYKEFDDEKKFPRLENSPLPHNFSTGSPLVIYRSTSWKMDCKLHCDKIAL